MRSQNEPSWTNGLIPVIDPESVAGIVSRLSDLALLVTKTGLIKGIFPSPEFASRPDLKTWVGRPIKDVLTVESMPKFEARLDDFLKHEGDVLSVQVNHVATESGGEFPIRYSLHPSGADDAILLLGRDLSQEAEVQRQLVTAQIALENDYEEQREQDLRFRVLMESSDIATAFVSVKTGRIVASNGAAETLLGKKRGELVSAPFAREFEVEGHRDLVDQLVTVASEQTGTFIKVRTSTGSTSLDIAPTLFRGASGQMLLCKITVSGAQEVATDSLQQQLLDLYQHGLDSIVFMDASGHILSANDAFLKVADVTHSQSIKNRPIMDFFGRGSVDLNVILENVRRTGGMRLYSTKIVGEHGVARNVDISTTRLKAGSAAVYALIIRDARRVDVPRTQMQQVTEMDTESVSELIGTHSLKDIVARTTDVVEKMCIEAAIEMTSNNRVAAAEMLGLSRQSLYVKLRKYELVERS